MANKPVFGGLGEPSFIPEAGVIDFPCLDWEFTEAKARVIADAIVPDLCRHTRGGTYVVWRTDKAPGCIRLVWSSDDKMPTHKMLMRHAEAFSNLFCKPHYDAAMRDALPSKEAELAANRSNLDRELRAQQYAYSQGERFDHESSL